MPHSCNELIHVHIMYPLRVGSISNYKIMLTNNICKSETFIRKNIYKTLGIMLQC